MPGWDAIISRFELAVLVARSRDSQAKEDLDSGECSVDTVLVPSLERRSD